MEYALPTAWGNQDRGFWTKRKKTAMSMLAVLALIAGIALAFKLFEQ
jgi:preprotein translocase subunit SecE